VRFKCISARWLAASLAWVFLLTFLQCRQPLPGPGDQPPSPGKNASPGHTSAGSTSQHTTSDHGSGSFPFDRHPEHLVLTRHARCRMDCRHITEKEIREILENGEINYHKSQPQAHPDPKYAVEGETVEGQRLRVVFAVPSLGGVLVVVTCIELGVEWQCACH
jgi:hypothetical protein